MCLLDVEGMEKPNLVSSITVCNSEIRCIAMVPCGLHGHLSNCNDTPHLQGRLSHALGTHDEVPHTAAQNRTEDGREQSKAGAEGSEAGGDGSEAGGEGSEAGGEGSEAGGEGSEAGGDGSEAGGEGSEAGAEGSEAGAEESEAGGEGPEAGAEGSEAEGEGSEAGGDGSQVGIEGSEVGGDGSEVGVEGSETGGEGSEAGEKGLNVREHWPNTIGEEPEVCECYQEAVGEGQEEEDEGTKDGEQWMKTGREGPEKGEQWLEAGEEGLEAEQEEPEVGKEAPDAGGEGPVFGRDRIDVAEHWLEAGQEMPKPGVEEGPGTEGEGPEFEGQRLEATSEGEEPLFGLEYCVAGEEGAAVADLEQEAGQEAPQAVGDGQEFGGEGMEVAERCLEAGGERPEPGRESPQAERAEKGCNSVQRVKPAHESVFRSLGSQKTGIAALTQCEPHSALSAQWSNDTQHKGITSPLAFQELNKSEGQLSASGSICTGANNGHRGGQEAREPSVSHQRQLKVIPLHLERNDSDPERVGGDTCRSPCEDTCVTAHTLDSARSHDIHSRDSWGVSHGASNVQPGTEDLSVRGRSYSAPPDPLEVIKTQLRNRSVTICESPDEISVQMQQPRQMSSVPAHSYNHLAETSGPQPISPLTLKPVEHSSEVWLGTGEGR